MTDKELDKILNTALNSDEVPPALKSALLEKINKRQKKKAKLYSFVKIGSACAAVFVCALAVVSYFNSDMIPQKGVIDSPSAVSDKDNPENTSDSTTKATYDTPSQRKAQEPSLSSFSPDVPESKSAVNDSFEFDLAAEYTEESAPIEITAEEALNIAKKECNIIYDKTDISYDPEKAVWKVVFSKSDTQDNSQRVYVDIYGTVLSAE